MAPAFAESIAVKFYEVFLYGVFFGDLMAVAVVVEGSTAWSAIKTAAASSGLRMWTATHENLRHLGMGLAEVSYGNVSGGVGIIANVEETQVLVVYGPMCATILRIVDCHTCAGESSKSEASAP